jgi:hypothetical protein
MGSPPRGDPGKRASIQRYSLAKSIHSKVFFRKEHPFKGIL